MSVLDEPDIFKELSYITLLELLLGLSIAPLIFIDLLLRLISKFCEKLKDDWDLIVVIKGRKKK